MSSVSKFRMSFAFIFAIAATVIVWLLLSDSSPLYFYFLYHVTIPNMMRKLIVVPYVIMMILRPARFGDDLAYALVFLQWLLVGYVLAILLSRKRDPGPVSILRDTRLD